MFLWLLLSISLNKAQTILDDFPDPVFFDLQVADDGRLVSNIRGGDYFGEGDPYLDVYRNFIEINRDTGSLLIVFGVAEFDLIDNGFLKSVSLKSGTTRTGPPLDASFPKPDWYDDNMILWFDEQAHAFVMLYQEGCYSCLEAYYDKAWLIIPWFDAMNQTVKKSMTYDDGKSWHNTMEILKDQLENPHVQFQIIPGVEKNEDGYSKEIIIPIHHLDETVLDSNYQMIWRCNRDIDPEDGSWTVVNMTNTSSEHSQDFFGAHIQATVVRNEGDEKLVAFLRDRYGNWVHRAESSDDGKTWTEQMATPLPNPDLMVQAIALHNGHIMIIYNPQQSDSYTNHTADRDDNSHILAISISENGGLSWIYSRILEYAYDGKFLYPSGVQDPWCSNVYLTYSTLSNEPDQGCGALNEAGMYEEYDRCLQRGVSMTYIKFTVLNEEWVRDPHNWELDQEGCQWGIKKDLQMQISEVKQASSDGFNVNDLQLVEFSEIWSTGSLNKNIIVLGVFVGLCAMWSLGLLFYTFSFLAFKY